MGIEIIIKKDTIDNLQDKLEGKIPVTYEDLLVLISSHGLYNKLSIKSNNKTINIESQYPSECYNLSKLDTSNITDMNHLFMNSMFNGDISNWNMTNVTNMDGMFYKAKDFTDIHSTNGVRLHNQSIGNWDVSNVTSMNNMFYGATKFNSDISNWDVSNVTDMDVMFDNAKSFNQNISSWNFDNIINCDYMFNKAKEFLDKYNSGEPLPKYTDDIKFWVNINRDRMNAINIKEKHGKEVDSFFSNFSNKEISKEI